MGITWRLTKIKKLIQEYYYLQAGHLIEKHSESMFLFEVKGIKICISRRSLKHYIERRKKELQKNHTNHGALSRIYFAINHLKEIITDYDSYSQNIFGERLYSKNYILNKRRAIRVLMEKVEDRLEIKSIHFKTKNTPD